MTTSDLPRRRRLRVIRSPQSASVLDRPVSWRWLSPEILLYFGLILLSFVMHIWGLGTMAMHHDESIHAKFSWEFYTGNASFSCWNGRASDSYCYNPVFHGPTLYILTYLSYFLFGVSEVTARLPMALAGVGLVASCWMLRPLVGRRAALWSAGLMLISPTLLYFTRFARHDALALLWTFWMMVGLFRFFHDRRARWLYLAAAAMALLWATHELVFIIGFVLFTFLAQRFMWESLSFRRFFTITGLVMAVSVLFIIFNPAINLPTPQNQPANVIHLGGFGLIAFMTLLVGQLASLHWSSKPLLSDVLRQAATWRTFVAALGVFFAVFTLCFTVFFTDPMGFVDGLYAGIGYWLGTQHAFARGDQPWYYYFMQLGIYEILAITLFVIGSILWFARPLWQQLRTSTVAQPKAPADALADDETITVVKSEPLVVDEFVTPIAKLSTADDPFDDGASFQVDAYDPALEDGSALLSEDAAPLQRFAYDSDVEDGSAVLSAESFMSLWVGFSFYWFLLNLTVFSWAGEKMPWLTIHMTLPAILVGGWTLARLTRGVNWQTVRQSRSWLVLPLTALGTVLLIVASASFGGGAELSAQRSVLDGLSLMIFVVLCGVAIWYFTRFIGGRSVLKLVTLAFTAMLALYSVRATFLASYVHPDVPVEFLVYTQSAPDMPRITEQVERIAVAQTRTRRDVNDPTGGHSMQILISQGKGGTAEGSLRQPLDWYFRDWTNIDWVTGEQIASLTPDQLKAPVAIFSNTTMAPDTEQVMENAGYVKIYDSIHNWWFPEKGKGYKDRLYDPAYGCDPSLDGQQDENGRSKYDCTLGGVQILTWPFRPSNWDTLRNYMFWRRLPEGATITGREITVFMKRDVAPLPNSSAPSVANGSGILNLVSAGPLQGPAPVEVRGVDTGPDGTVYIVDSGSNEILVFHPDGTNETFVGDEDIDFLEPSDVATDEDGNLYVADTWRARVVKLDSSGKVLAFWGEGKEVFDETTMRIATQTGGTAEGNAANPLGFFGPRGIAYANGLVYLADTGNKRVVITDVDGNVKGQVGTAGAGPAQFNEPIGIAVASNSLIVADTWNGRVQVFTLNPDGLPNPLPATTFAVPGWNADTYLDPFLAVDDQGRIIVTIPEQNLASLYDLAGNLLLTWGGGDTPDTSMQHPSGVSFAPDGSVYIAEKRAQQVQRWELPRVR